ncbi:MAG TPA: PKD domain-containing protein [Vicinamibacterales bacterium]|nr:PKD domain-containing protein [Vicinamibacterales bacterium]
MKVRTLIGITLVAGGASIASSERAAAQTAQNPVEPIAFESCYFDAWNYYDYVCDIVVRRDGIDTVVASPGSAPKWSPDGERIAFAGPSWDPGIKVVGLADLRVQNLTGTTAFDWAPAWSPDGSTIAFVSDRTGTAELYRVNDDGSGLGRLTTSMVFGGQFAWSPDGRAIAIAGNRDGGNDLYTIDPDGSSLVRLTSGGGIGTVAWSSDSTRIAFDCDAELCRIDADGTGLVRLTATTGRNAVFAPADGRIAFVTAGFGQGDEIAIRNEDGTIVRVAAATPGINPVWSPDGTRLLFEGTNPFGYEGCCFNGCNGDTYCVPAYGLYMVDVAASSPGLLGKGSNADWYGPRPGQPLASFTYQCDGARCDFDAHGSADPNGAIVSYTWGFGDATTGAGSTVSHTYMPGGTYLVTLRVTDNDGLTSAVTLRIEANAPPTAAFAVTCAAATCTFDASGSADPDGPIASYQWTFGDGASSFYPTGSPTATHTYKTGTFTVLLVVTDYGGVTATASATVQTINQPPVASFTKTCDFARCTFDATASADPEGRALRYSSWSFGDGHHRYDSTAIQEHTYSAAGSYAVVLTVVDGVGQQATVADTITILPASMHVGDLDGLSTQATRPWSVLEVSLVVHDGDHRPVANARVVGMWSTGESRNCATDAAGRCAVAAAVRGSQAGVSFTIQRVEHALYVYRGNNHDPDGDSDGTTFTFKRK